MPGWGSRNAGSPLLHFPHLNFSRSHTLRPPDSPLARALIYRRVSTDEQAESGAGLNAQLDACHLFATRQKLPVAGVFTDEDESGATPLEKRPGLLGALGELGPGD